MPDILLVEWFEPGSTLNKLTMALEFGDPVFTLKGQSEEFSCRFNWKLAGTKQ